ncbi:SIS domain-containing protein [Sinorhizobium alkalisoli]|uniref:SIS domain-containing protein n=1 Tax=Sinorhizobium alkalisoli TaxID=1752398 RepID=UPI0012A93D47|nr:SIS domain-containing protein [Sinorhizobium alkalisoli]QFI68774.1 Glucosamine-6-phosphate deaminase [isomerizing], alternative [Sinorhizobium alkalisoli]
MNETQMSREIREIPAVVEHQVTRGAGVYHEAGKRLRHDGPRFLVSCARGSSDQAVTYFKYLLETRLGIPLASIGPSIASVYDAPLRLDGAALLTVSQSGGSPDLVSLQAKARGAGARAVALLNETDSPVGKGADTILPMCAGPEKAVAATKSFVASLVALASVIASWSEDKELLDALQRLPEALAKSLACDWTPASIHVASAHSLYTISRGPGLAIAGEAALKFKETCRLHAEAYSAAEVRHGPIALARDRFAALVFANGDQSDTSILDAADHLSAAGARVFIVGGTSPGALPVATAPHALLAPICHAVNFYRFVETLSVSLGENPDAPALLRKVTETV